MLILFKEMIILTRTTTGNGKEGKGEAETGQRVETTAQRLDRTASENGLSLCLSPRSDTSNFGCVAGDLYMMFTHFGESELTSLMWMFCCHFK